MGGPDHPGAMPMTILGAVLSLAVIVGAIVLTKQIRTLCRQLDADRKLARLELRPPDSPVRSPPKLTVLPYLRGRFRPYRAACIAGSGLLGVLATAAAFVIVDPHTATPVAQAPPVTTTVTTTATPDAVTAATIVLDGQQPAADLTGVTKTPLPMPMSPVALRTRTPLPSPLPGPGPGNSSDRIDPPPSSNTPPPSSVVVQTTIPPAPPSSASIAVQPSP